MIKHDNFIIIPIEATCLVVKVEDGKLVGVTGGLDNKPVHELLNEVRSAIHDIKERAIEKFERTSRGYKRFNAVREFLDEAELEYYTSVWGTYNLQEVEAEHKILMSNLNRAMFEVADLMLDFNVPVRALGSENPDSIAPDVNLDQVKNLLAGLGKSE
jgi:hypothetical protein